MTSQEKQRIAAAIGWSLDNHQIPKSLVHGNDVWNYSGTISNYELRLYEENGPDAILEIGSVKQLFPPAAENRNVEFSERKWINGYVNGTRLNSVVMFHDDVKGSRVLNLFINVGYAEVGVRGGLTYEVVR